MRKMLILSVALGLCACGKSEAKRPPQTQHSIISNATSELGRSLLAAHATFDDAAITGLRQTGQCEAVITTAKGATPVRWKDLGNLAPRLKGNQTVFTIPTPRRTHVISARTGDNATGINIVLGLLDEACGGV